MKSGIGVRWIVLGAIGLTVWAMAASGPVSTEHRILIGILATLAILAEFIPIDLPRRGFRITLSLPFLVGMVHIGSSHWALAASGVGALLAGMALIRTDQNRIAWRRILLHLALAAGAGSVATLALAGCRAVLPVEWLRSHFEEVVFASVFVLSHVGLVLSLGRQHEVGQREDSTPRSLIGVVGLLALYSLTSLGVLVLIDHGIWWALPLLFVPLLTIRQAVHLNNQLEETYTESVITLTLMLQRTHPYSHGHLGRVARLAERTALRLGLSTQRAAQIRHAALLHDIGKIAIDEEILDKPGKLTESEMDHVRLHPELGAQILRQNPEFAGLAEWIRHHHERPDGTGYPGRLRDVEIPLESKIIAVTDAFDAMVGGALPHERRTYREPMSQEEGLRELKRCAGTQFDPRVVEAFTATVLEAGA
ncbi:MAG TPA: HD-GYP domain-containing protein [Fimbriimonadaceae bacterium]|nr:HD-GYP domain-containing protein [Fimbriimonadaceae bacterium]